MQELSFVGLSPDGSALTVALPDGRRYLLPIDERVRAAVRGGGRASHVGGAVEAMRPRDLQARLRAGATTTEVAEISGWALERVEAFAVPVMQERSFVAQRAAASPIPVGEVEIALEEHVRRHLLAVDIDPDELRWDAWRREDEHWIVMLSYPAGRGDQVATWLFDTQSRTLVPQDDQAARLVGEVGTLSAEPAGDRDDGAVDVRSEGAQVVSLTPAPADSPTSPRHPAGRRGAHPAGSRPIEQDSIETDEQDAHPPASPADRRPTRSTQRRASVPSWDEVLFGSDSTRD